MNRAILPTTLALMAALAATACGDDPSPQTTLPLRILVTNDDGVGAEGLDAVVEALVADAANEVVVCAPNGNRSGSGDRTGPSEICGNLSVATTTTRSGYPATAIDGCPADAVLFALSSIYSPDAPPQVLIAGINEGQNVSRLVATQLSGTVGAARTAARQNVPALAASQGLPAEDGSFDYPAGVQAVLTWLEANRAALADGSAPARAESTNIPSCNAGTIRGTIIGLPLAPTPAGILDPQDCTSTLEDPQDDVEAFNNGFVTLTQVPLN